MAQKVVVDIKEASFIMMKGGGLFGSFCGDDVMVGAESSFFLLPLLGHLVYGLQIDRRLRICSIET